MRIYSRVSTKPLPNDAKRLLPVEVRRSKTLLLKLPNMFNALAYYALVFIENFCRAFSPGPTDRPLGLRGWVYIKLI